jgi:hypothetical protein
MTQHESDWMNPEALASLPRELTPGRDLWPGIEARIAPPARGLRGWAAQIAAAVALVALSSLLTAVVIRRGSAEQGVMAGTSGAPPVTRVAAFGPGYSLDAEYQAARQQLAAQLESRVASLPPAARDKLEWNLAELHRATREINEALAREPGDPLLEELLLSTYQDELRVLGSVTQLTGAGVVAMPERKEKVQL